MISLTINRHHHRHGLINPQQLPPVLIVYHHLNQFILHCLIILLLLTFTVQSQSNLTNIKSLSTTPANSLIDSDDYTTNYNFLNSVTLVNNLSAITESTLTIDLSTKTIGVFNNATDNNLDSSTINHIDNNETSSTVTTVNPSHVTLFLDGEDEVNTLPPTTIHFDGTNNLTDFDAINSNEIINSSSSSSSPTINPNVLFKSSTLPNTNDNETTTTINFNQSPTLIDSETTTIVTIDMINNNDTINSTVISSTNNETTLSSSSTNLVFDTSNQTICDSTNNQIADHTNLRLTIDHYEAKKFFLFTMILLGLCCLLTLIVLILVVYIFRKLTRERTIKLPQANNNNHIISGGCGGSIEFDTIKDGPCYQWQGNVNSGFDSSDLNESTTQSTGYRFHEGSVVPYTDRYHGDLKASSTETFGHHHHHHNQPHHLNQSSSVNSLPKSATITTVDTRL